MPLMQKNHVQQKLSKKNSLLFLYKKTYSSSESKAFFKSSILSTFSIIDTTSYKNNNILKVKYQQKRVQPRTLLTDYKFNTILYIFYINIIV